MTTVTYNESMNAIMMAMLEAWNIKENKTIRFSKETTLNLDSLDKRISIAKRSLPPDYIKKVKGANWWDNKPNEDSAVWFTSIF